MRWLVPIDYTPHLIWGLLPHCWRQQLCGAACGPACEPACGAGAASGLAVEALLVLDDGVVRMTDGAIDGMLPNLDGIKLFCLICK